MKKQRKENTGNMVFGVRTMLLILMITFCITGTVRGSENQYNSYDGVTYNEAYYDEIETQYQQEISLQLEAAGLYHSGITMTKITQENGSRSYQVQIHNGMISKMSTDRLTQLETALRGVPFSERSCGIELLVSGQ